MLRQQAVGELNRQVSESNDDELETVTRDESINNKDNDAEIVITPDDLKDKEKLNKKVDVMEEKEFPVKDRFIQTMH